MNRLTREQPWSIRRAWTQHHLWYRNLRDLHGLTLAWLRRIGMERPSGFLRRGLGEEISETLWSLERMEGGDPLESLLDDTAPEDLLSRMERAVHVVQGGTLASLLERAAPKDEGSLRDALAESSREAGRECAQGRWGGLPSEARADLRGLLAAYRDSPLAGRPIDDPLLVRRATARELELELRSCPHQSAHAEVRSVAGELCALHAHWTRGFAETLAAGARVEHVPVGVAAGAAARTRCEQRWWLAP